LTARFGWNSTPGKFYSYRMQTSHEQFSKSLEAAFHAAQSYLDKLDATSVGATADLKTLRSQLRKPLTANGMPPEQVIAELARDVNGGLIGTGTGRFFGWVIGGAVPAALGADILASVWDQNAGLYATSPASAVVEEVAGAWLKEILGLPAHASFALVTGCQAAHTTCLAAARHAVLARFNWDLEEKGLFGAPPIRVLTSGMRHGTFDRAVRLLGLGKSQVQLLDSDENDCLRADALERALQNRTSSPTIVLLQAGDVNIGAIDDFKTLIPIARRHNAWVHVDGAFGLWAAASPRYKHLVAGVEAADSWATDGHKWLNVPFDCGYAFVADPASHRASMSHRAPYLIHDSDARDQMDWNPEWSRRARGFATYAALRQLGRNGVAEIVENCCEHAHSLVMKIGKLPSAEVVWEPTINQGLVRFLDAKRGATREDHDRRTDEVIAAIVASGEAFFGGTTWRGRRAMRVSVSCWRTASDDVRRTVSAVEKVLREVPI
jgi:glutamate/tyrosine decarboxylase-like PLP-dependent enzyme